MTMPIYYYDMLFIYFNCSVVGYSLKMLKNSNGETSNSSTTTDLNVDSGNVNGVLTEPENYRRTFSAKAGPKLKSGLDVE